MEPTTLLPALLRTTFFLTATGLTCYLALRNTGDRMPRLSRFLWLAVLLTGWFWIRPVVEIPWTETAQKSAPIVTTTTEPVPTPVFESKLVPIIETATNPEPIVVVPSEPVSVSKKIEWKPLIFKTVFAVWLGGMVVSIFLSAIGYLRFLSLLRKAVPASDDFAGPWRRLLDRHGIDARSIPMFVSESRENLGPALIRLPTEYRLIVPRELWSELSEAGRSGILKHELEHFRRRDVWKSLFVRILALPHWFNPVAHLAVHRFEEAAELLCDRAAFDLEQESVLEFARTLLLLHENAPTHFVARQSIFGRGLKHRVACLLHENQNETKKVSTMKKILLLTGTAVVLAACLFRFELVEKIVAQTNGDPSETQKAKQTVRLAKDDVLVFDDGKWKNKKSLVTIPVGTVVEGTHGTFRLDAVGEYGTVTKLSGGGATGTGKHIELSDGGNAISTSVLSPEEMKNVIIMDEKDVFVFDNGVWTNEKTGKEIEPGSYVAGARGAFRLEKKDDIGSIVLISGAGAIGSGKYIRWSNGGSGFSGGKSAKNVSNNHRYSSVIEAETNKPMAAVKATLYFAKNGKVETRSTQTDAEGRILFPLPSELHADMEAGMDILVEKDGYVSERDGRQAKWSERFLKEGKEICKTFPLQKAETITGRLVDETGKPLAGVTIAVLRQLVKPFGHEGRMRTESFDLKSDATGRFKIAAAKNEKIVLWAVPEDLAPAFVYPDQKRGDLGDIQAVRGIRPEVKVLDKDGKPVSDVWVNISREEGEEYYGISYMPQSGRSALTNTEGIARFRPVIEGKYRVRINERPSEKKYNPDSIEQRITSVWGDKKEDSKPVKGVFAFSTVDFSKSNLTTTLQARKTLQVDIRFSDKTAVSERDFNVNISGNLGNENWYFSRPSSDSPTGYKGDGLFSYQAPIDLKDAKLNLHSKTDYSYRVRIEGNSNWIEPVNGYLYPLGPIMKDTKIDVTVYKSPKVTLDVVDETGEPVKEFYGWAEYADTKTPAKIKFDGDKIRVDITPERWHEMTWEWATSEVTMGGILDVHFKYKNFGKSEKKINNEGILPGRELRLYVVGKGYEIQSQTIPGMKEGEEKTVTVTVTLKKAIKP